MTVAGEVRPDVQSSGLNSEVADRLRKAVRLGGGNKAVATKSGIPLGTLNNYVREVHRLPADAAAKIAQACNVSIDWLLRGDGPMEYLPVGVVTAEGHTVEIGGAIRLKGDPRQPGAIAIAEGELDPELPDDFIEKFNPDRLASALKLAEELFAAENRRPTDRQRIQTMVLIYNHLTNQVVEALRKQSASFQKETESK